MYNTLKEIQNSLSIKDLYRFGNEATNKTAEEIIDIFKKDNIVISLDAAKECVDFLKDIDSVEIQDEELGNVTGGTCYGGDGVVGPEPDFAKHPYVVVTVGNSCPGYDGDGFAVPHHTCACCCRHFWRGAREYCSIRWKGHERLANPSVKEYGVFLDGERNW